MQNPNPSHNPFFYPSLLQQLLERTLFGARSTSAAAPTSGDTLGADAARGEDPACDDTGDPGDAAGRLELAELLGVMREPIEWVFTLAERRAQGDAVDIAAIHRVRKAILHRVNSTIGGVPPDEELARIRAADLVTIASRLIGTLDPALVQRAMQSVGSRIADVFTVELEVDPSLYLGRAASPSAGLDMPSPIPPWYPGGIPARPVAPYGSGASMPHTSVAYGGYHGAPWYAGSASGRPIAPSAYGAPCTSSCTGLHMLRPVAHASWSFPFAF